MQMKEQKTYPGQLVFGLDIGTRSIVGIVGYKSGDDFFVVAQESIEHKTRSMLDGQIHDIRQVSQTIAEVKASLEWKLGRTLKEACIAAAGRVLKTLSTHVELEFPIEKEIEQSDIYSLDSLGVEQAYEEFMVKESPTEKFYCVGYTVCKYYLNEYPISNLLNHKARKVSADLIATFLPDDVVDGLYRAVEMADLKVANLTLEPIAAMQVAIPPMYRMLNIALVDVGAGTSDICITKDGSVNAYGMIPQAGDSLTEAIAKKCLVDFQTAEMIKRKASEEDKIDYMDIMLLPQSITKEEVEEIVDAELTIMATNVANRIKELNGGKSVSAVFVIGGGGKFKGYTEKLAEELMIPRERVALRGSEVMQQVTFMEDVEKDSLLVTPVGICMNFYEQNNNFIYVLFNGEKIKLYDNGRLTVVDVAMQANFPKEDLFPRRGKALEISVNGKTKIIRGEQGESAHITVNGQIGDLHKAIQANDEIVIKTSTVGADASIMLSELLENKDSLAIKINDVLINLPRLKKVNGNFVNDTYKIKDKDQIELLNYYTLDQLAAFMDVTIEEEEPIYVNRAVATKDSIIYEDFSVQFQVRTQTLSSMSEEEIKLETEQELEQELEAELEAEQEQELKTEDFRDIVV